MGGGYSGLAGGVGGDAGWQVLSTALQEGAQGAQSSQSSSQGPPSYPRDIHRRGVQQGVYGTGEALQMVLERRVGLDRGHKQG